MNENGLHNTLNASTENRLGQIIVSVGSIALLALVGFWAFTQEAKGDLARLTPVKTAPPPIAVAITPPISEPMEFEAAEMAPTLATQAVYKGVEAAPAPKVISQMEWQKLSVSQSQGQATLSWLPAHATAIQYILIERSFDRQRFEAIDTLHITDQAQLTSAQKWTDSVSAHGSFPRVSYRLCSHGQDQQEHRSAMITIDLGLQEGLYSLQTGIQQDQVQLLVASDFPKDSVKLELVDIYGTPITDTTISAGRQARVIPLTTRVQPLTPEDEYYVRMSNQSAQLIQKLRWD